MRKLRILWLKTGPLHPLDSGGKLRTYHTLRELSREHRVTYLSLCSPETGGDVLSAASEYSAEQIWIPWRETPKQSVRFLADLAANFFGSRLPYVIAKYRSREMAAAIRREDAARGHDLMVCDFLTLAVNLGEVGSGGMATPTLLFEHNVESLIWRRMAESAGGVKRAYFNGQWRRMRRFEAAACARCDGVVTVSEADSGLLSSEFGLKNVLGSVPTGVDVDYFAGKEAAERNGSLVFLGSMDWMPNIDGALWFAEEIWPRIKAGAPGVTLTIVGRKPVPEIEKLAARDPAIRVTGTVADVRPYLAEARLMVVPLRIGGGTRIKIFEGMAAGVPVISTRIGAEGLSVTDGENIVLADAPEEFAAKTIELLIRPERRSAIAGNGCRLVREKFSWRAVSDIFAGHCEKMARNQTP